MAVEVEILEGGAMVEPLDDWVLFGNFPEPAGEGGFRSANLFGRDAKK